MKKILLHSCCAPCTTYTYKYLKDDGFEVTSLYYNPNIYPAEEYWKRYLNLKNLSEAERFGLIFEFENIKFNGSKCDDCYTIRLTKTAEMAADKGFDWFTTTLLISPYQNHERIIELAEGVSKDKGIRFYYNDLRKGYRESKKLSKEFGLYRQKYCGCETSLKNGN
jgi:predicted adenine nucleotide alpha hydrolase (AANH) superfamily ATPase